MKITYYNPETVDCTADPHPVNYPAIKKACEDILKVLESPLVFAVRVTYLYTGEEEENTMLQSDRYSLFDYDNKRKKADSSPEAEQHKIRGLYFEGDPVDYVKRPDMSPSDAKGKKFFVDGSTVYEILSFPRERHLRPGITGARKALQKITETPEKYKSLSIGVVWTAFMDHSCSDYIKIDDITASDVTVDYSNQDDYVGGSNYNDHIDKLRALLGEFGDEIEPGDGK